jgi:hypothetical protein
MPERGNACTGGNAKELDGKSMGKHLRVENGRRDLHGCKNSIERVVVAGIGGPVEDGALRFVEIGRRSAGFEKSLNGQGCKAVAQTESTGNNHIVGVDVHDLGPLML